MSGPYNYFRHKEQTLSSLHSTIYAGFDGNAESITCFLALFQDMQNRYRLNFIFSNLSRGYNELHTLTKEG